MLVNRRTGHVVDGHLRVELALSKNEPSVPVLYVDLDPAEEALVLATLDPISAMAGTDDDKLRELLAEVSVESEALHAMLAQLAPPEIQSGLTDPDDIPAPPDQPTTRPGDLWVLGDHRLLCGDAGSDADLDRLLDGATIDLLVTDPPYYVRVEPRSNNAIAAGLSGSFDASYQAALRRAPSARRRSGLRHHQAFDLARHPEKARPTHRQLRAKDRPLANDSVSDAEFVTRLDAPVACQGSAAGQRLGQRCGIRDSP